MERQEGKEKEEEYLEVGEDEVHIPADRWPSFSGLKTGCPTSGNTGKIEMARDSSDGEGGEAC